MIVFNICVAYLVCTVHLSKIIEMRFLFGLARFVRGPDLVMLLFIIGKMFKRFRLLSIIRWGK